MDREVALLAFRPPDQDSAPLFVTARAHQGPMFECQSQFQKFLGWTWF
jgi:hypothetical protein